MSNKKNVPVAGKTVAGKNNFDKKNKKNAQKKRTEAEKNARRVIEEKQKKQKQREKRSEEIRKQRRKANEKQTRATTKQAKKAAAKAKQKSRKENFGKKVRYYTSKEFLGSFNYFRIFVFIVVPIALIVFGAVSLSQSVFMNVPAEIKSTEFNGRIESEAVAEKSVFNSLQQQVFIDSLKAKGNKNFKFYINSVIKVDDDFTADELCLGNPSENDCILIATIYDSDGQVLYRSLGIEPGTEINRAKLFTELSYGVHDVKVAVNAYDKNNYNKIGTQYAKIKLAVGVEYNGEK